MNKLLFSSIGLLLMTPLWAMEQSSLEYNPNALLLPSPYPVHILKNNGVINHSVEGAQEALLPTDNTYTDTPGCYIACYSHKVGVYPVSSTIYVMGQIRVGGAYAARICQPEGYKNTDISKSDQLKELCAEHFAACSNKACWAGGDTGGWFGVQ